MTYVEINGKRYPATFDGMRMDPAWGWRETKTINLSSISYADVLTMFADNTPWSIVLVEPVVYARIDDNGDPVLDENGDPIYDEGEKETVLDNSEYCLSGTISVKMGKKTTAEEQTERANEAESALEEAYTIMYGGV